MENIKNIKNSFFIAPPTGLMLDVVGGNLARMHTAFQWLLFFSIVFDHEINPTSRSSGIKTFALDFVG